MYQRKRSTDDVEWPKERGCAVCFDGVQLVYRHTNVLRYTKPWAAEGRSVVCGNSIYPVDCGPEYRYMRTADEPSKARRGIGGFCKGE